MGHHGWPALPFAPLRGYVGVPAGHVPEGGSRNKKLYKDGRGSHGSAWLIMGESALPFAGGSLTTVRCKRIDLIALQTNMLVLQHSVR